MKQHKHLGAYALAIKDDAILLIKKARGPYIGKWDLPGGSLEFGESPFDCLSREVLEETGLSVQKGDLLDVLSHVVSYKSDNGEQEEMHHLGMIYLVVLDSLGELKVGGDGEDSNGASWVKVTNINRDNSAPFIGESIKTFF